MQKAAQAYLQTNIATNSPGEIVIMLYDGAIKFLNRAKEQIDKKDYAGKGISISRSMDIINELNESLNIEKGGVLAENLHKLYFWCITRLAMANLKMDTSIIDTVIKVLAGIRSAYVQIQSMPEAQATSAELAARQEAEGTSSARMAQALSGPARQQMPPAPQASIRGRNAYSKLAVA